MEAARKTLKKVPTLDYEYLTQEVAGGELRRLMETLRSDVETFYQRGSFSEKLSSMNQQAAEAERKQKELENMSLKTKSDAEVVQYLNDKENILVQKALETLLERLQKPSQNLILKIQDAGETLVRILGTKDLAVLEKALRVFSIILEDGRYTPNLKKLGAIRPLAKILAAPELVDNYGLLESSLAVVVRAVRCEDLRDLFRTVNGMGRLTQFLANEKHPEIQLMATEALFFLSLAKDNKLPLVKSGIFDIVLKNLKGLTNVAQKKMAVGVMRNLAEIQFCQEHVQVDDFRQLLVLLDPAQTYKDQTPTPNYKIFIELQITLLELLTELSAFEPNQKSMGSLACVKTLNEFFYPMNPGAKAKWDFEILKRVLQLLGNVVQTASNRNVFLETKGAQIMTSILKATGLFPQDVLIEAASVLTTLCTKASMNQQAYHKLGVQVLMGLVPNFPKVVEISEFCAIMINVAASKGINKSFLIAEGADSLLIKFIKTSKEAAVLINSCEGLAHLCTETSVVKNTIDSDIVKTLISFFGLKTAELSTNVARVLAAVADGEGGAAQIVTGGGIVPLVQLIGQSQPNEVKEQALLTFGKILFCPGGQTNIEYFFGTRGEGPLLECLFSDAEEVQVPAASIVHGLTVAAENREVLRMAKIEEKLGRLEEHQNVVKDGSQVANFLRLIKVHLKKDATTVKLVNTAANEREKEKRALPKIWMKAIYEYKAKMLPMKENMQWNEFVQMIITEFGIDSWAGLNLKTALVKEEIRIVDQNRLDFLIACIQKDEAAHLIINSDTPTLPFNPNSSANKLDGLLSKLDHRQLRTLLKQAIDQDIDLTEPIRNYMNVNRAAFGIYTAPEDREDAEPGAAGAKGGKVANRPLPKSSPIPPPPPQLNMASKKGVKATISASAETGKAQKEEVNFMDALKNAVESGAKKNLTRVELDNDERSKRGMEENEPTAQQMARLKRNVLEEDVEQSPKLWEIDSKLFLNKIQDAFVIDYQVMNVVFQVIDNEMLDWKDVVAALPALTPEKIVEALLLAGLDIKFQSYRSEGSKKIEKEYIAVLCPAELPRWSVLKTISIVIKENGGTTNVVNSNQTVGWTSKKNAPTQIGSLW